MTPRGPGLNDASGLLGAPGSPRLPPPEPISFLQGSRVGLRDYFAFSSPPNPTARAPAVLLSPSEGTSAGFGMDFVVLERSTHIPFGFPLNHCIVCLHKKPHPRSSGCPKWLIPEVLNRRGLGCVSGRGFLSVPWFLAPGNELLCPQILTPLPFPQRDMLCCGRCSRWDDADRVHPGSPTF